MYINDTSRDIDSLHCFPLAKKVFVAKNTALPSSALQVLLWKSYLALEGKS